MKTYTVGDINPRAVIEHENAIPVIIAHCRNQATAKLITRALTIASDPEALRAVLEREQLIAALKVADDICFNRTLTASAEELALIRAAMVLVGAK